MKNMDRNFEVEKTFGLGVLLTATKATLVKLAALVWFAGVLVLLFKSVVMLIEAVKIGAPVSVTVSAVIAGLVIGMIKAKYLFIHICKRNIKRIFALKSPKIWQFYRIKFFFFLFLMITLGNYAYRLSSNSVFLLFTLSVLELPISTALAISGKCFIKIRMRL